MRAEVHMRRGVTPAVLGLLTVVCLCLAAHRNRALLARREKAGINAAQPLENAPPMVAFTTVVLGGFRGVLADVLWLRVSALQDRGRYFEIVQLADWITKLEPRSSSIWAFHAWNMAYNVSVAMADPEDRWRWVRNGILLLRDEGLVYNPADPELHKELGWLFQHKIGAPVDPLHMYFKLRWAETVEDVLGTGCPDYASVSNTTRARLRDELKLDAELMRAVDEEFGPLDWRLPETHAVYWAYRGLRYGKGDRKLSCRRMIFQSMATMVRSGNLRFEAETGRYETSPAPALVPRALEAYEEALRHHEEQSVRDAYVNFLRRTARSLHDAGSENRARQLYERFRERFPRKADNITYERFVLGKDDE